MSYVEAAQQIPQTHKTGNLTHKFIDILPPRSIINR